MFRTYGILGILLIVFVELNFLFKIEPFAHWYFPIIWFGYILTIDALVYKLRKHSLLMNRQLDLVGMFILSALFWWAFEFINSFFVSNWSYSSNGHASNLMNNIPLATISFATVLPAFFETVELVRSVHLFDREKLHEKFKISRKFLYTMIELGVLCLIAPMIFPKFAFPLIWFSFFLILDPINYIHKQPSIVGHLKDKNLVVPLSLLMSGIVVGFLWEFWNYWAAVKWTYNIPYVGFFKIFEMPILGYLGYFPFALELYAMYWFMRSLVTHKEHILAE